MKLGRVFGVALAVGLLLRALAWGWMDIQQDGNAYAAMGHALQVHGSFWMPWGDGLGLGTTPAASHHYPPLYPAILAGAYSVFGFSVATTKATAIAVSVAALATVWACTTNLYGRQTAWAVTGIVALVPRLIIVQGMGFSENLVLIFFTLTLWSILRSLKEPNYMVLGGLFAGLGYLTRAGMGPFFLLAGLGGLAWRIKHRGIKATASSLPYMVGGFIFFTLAASWAIRNVALFGDWQSSNYAEWATQAALSRPAWLVLGFIFKTAFFLLLLYLFVAVFKPEFQEAKKTWRTEADSGLWLSIGLVAGIGAAMAAIFFTVEATPPFWPDTERYLVIAYVPLLWLLFKGAQLASKSFRIRYVALAAIFIMGSAYSLAQPTQSPEDHAALKLDIHAGESIGVQGASLARYAFYPYLPTQDITEYVCQSTSTDPCPGFAPTFILGRNAINSTAYHLQSIERIHLLVGGDMAPVYVYRRN